MAEPIDLDRVLADVQRDREMAAKATPGPWERGGDVSCNGRHDHSCWHTFDVQTDIIPPYGESGPVAIASVKEFDNGSFIAHARNTINARCSTIESLAAELRAARERIAELEAKWQSIETAPRDETWFLACKQGTIATARMGKTTMTTPDGIKEIECVQIMPGRLMWNPTHWMPLPSPPEAALAAKEGK